MLQLRVEKNPIRKRENIAMINGFNVHPWNIKWVIYFRIEVFSELCIKLRNSITTQRVHNCKPKLFCLKLKDRYNTNCFRWRFFSSKVC